MPLVPQASYGRSGLLSQTSGPGDQRPGHGHVVVGQERDPVPDLGLGGEAGEVGDQRLAALVGRVGLAGDQQLDGSLLVQQQPGQPLLVLQQQGEPLVGGHPAGEADGQHLRVEGPVDPAELALAGPLASQARFSRPRTSSTSRSRAIRRTRQMSSSGCRPAAPRSGRDAEVGPEAASNSSVNSRLIQVPAWTPLVTCPIGTSACRSRTTGRGTCPATPGRGGG